MPAVTGLVVANFEKFGTNTSDAGRELVVSITKSGGGGLVHDELLAAYRQLTVSGGASKDAGTFAAIGTADGSAFVSGTTTVVFARLQTTGTADLTTIGIDSGDVVLAVVATFQPAL